MKQWPETRSALPSNQENNTSRSNDIFLTRIARVENYSYILEFFLESKINISIHDFENVSHLVTVLITEY